MKLVRGIRTAKILHELLPAKNAGAKTGGANLGGSD
jgi:hypothetical protein